MEEREGRRGATNRGGERRREGPRAGTALAGADNITLARLVDTPHNSWHGMGWQDGTGVRLTFRRCT